MEVIATGLGLNIFELFERVHRRQKATATEAEAITIAAQPTAVVS